MNTYIEAFITSDDAGELILSRLLSEEKRILTPNWYYSTELRVLNIELVFAPLFYFFSDWNTVRVLGSAIILLILLASAAVFGKQLGLGKNYTGVLAAILLIPFSEGYFLFVMTKTYYAPHITISFLTLAMLLYMGRCKSKRKTMVFTAAASVLAVLAGMGGLRQLLILYIPLFAASLLLVFGSGKKNRKADKEPTGAAHERDYLHLAAESLLLLLSSIAGYLINSQYLSKLYHFASWEELRFTGFSDFSYVDRYNIPIVVFAFPVILPYVRRKISGLSGKKTYALPLAALLLFAASGMAKYVDFQPTSEYVTIARVLRERGCAYGYATFWNGNVLTELSDGEIEVHCWGSDINAVTNVNDSFPWLQLTRHDTEIPEGDVFCLLDAEQMESSLAQEMRGAAILYSSDDYTLYWFDSYESMLSKITSYHPDLSQSGSKEAA